jgi:hypothetical protein
MHAERTRQNGSLRVVGIGMAGAGAVAELRRRVVDAHGPRELGMRHRAIFIDVAASAGAPERGEFPDDSLCVRGVAADAIHSRPVIHKGRGRMPVDDRCPSLGSMALIARRSRENMPGRLAFGGRAVVAAGARRGHAGVIDPGTREAHRTSVTRLTWGIRHEVVCWLSGRRAAGMAAAAIRSDSRMVHASSSEVHRALVAALARRRGDDMVRPLSGGPDAVVAPHAAVDDARMAHLLVVHGRA